MSNYINIRTGEYPLHEGDIRIIYQDIGSVFVCPPEYSFVEETKPPEYDEMKQRLEVTPVLSDGRWIMEWSVVELSPQMQEEMRKQKEAIQNPQAAALEAPGGEPDVI